MIELKFSDENPSVIRGNMAAMLGVDLATFTPASLPAGLTGGEAKAVIADSGAEVANRTGRRGKARQVDAATAETATNPPPVEPTPNISASPENRVDPTTSNPAPTTTAAAVTPPPVDTPKALTLDDVRNAAGDYVNKFGIDAAKVDLMDCLEKATGVRAISQLEGKDQETLGKAVAALKTAAQAEKRYGQ